MLRRLGYQRRCRQQSRICRNETLGAYLRHAAETWPERLDNSPLIAVDLELTGLDAKRHAIAAMGWVLVDQGRIRLGSARLLLIRPEQTVGASAAVHELTDSELEHGSHLHQALEELFSAARGRTWVFHHAALDVPFLQRACQQWASCRPPLPVLDTMAIERRRRSRRNQVVASGALALDALRTAYDLPSYPLHDAMMDALGTAELLLALGGHMAPNGSPELQDLLRVF